jgi:capsular exopolysaccharide synthesis family protein
MTNRSLPGRAETIPVTNTTDDLSETLRQIFWRHLWIVLLPIVLALSIGLIYQLRATPQYTSRSRLYVEQTGPTILERDASGVTTRWDSYLYTQAELLRSTEILSTAIKSPEMADLRSFAGIDSPISTLRRGLVVEVGKKDDIINVSFTCAHPQEAATIVNTVVDAYIASHNKRKSSLSAEAVKILGDERAKREKELNDKRQRLAEFELQNEDLVFGTDRDSNVILRSLEHLRLVLTEAEVTTLDSKAFYETCKKMSSNPSALREYVEAQRGKGTYVVVAGQASGLQADLQQLERERADCLQRLKPDTPAIAALDAEIAKVRQQILALDKEFAAVQLAVAEEQFLAAQKRQETLENHFEQQRRGAVALSNQLAQYTLLQSDYARTKTFCDTLDDRIRILGVDPQVGGLNVDILEQAQPPTSPSRPRMPKTMGLALCMGLFAGMGLALHREWKDKRLRSTEEIADLLELPILGVVPSMTAPNQTLAIRGQKVRISPDSQEAEAFRSLRTAIFHRAPKDRARTILVTSATTNEGKSTVVGNLAITMARAGQKVVVVDANLRRPGQYALFSMNPNGKGLTSVVAGTMSLEEAVVKTKIDNLNLLPSGPAVSNPAEMIDSESFAGILKKLASQYDRIIVDSPAVLAVSDAQILATRCDATVLVIRAQASSRNLSVQAQNRLVSVDARMLGVVVNDVRLKGNDYGYSGKYDYRRDAARREPEDKRLTGGEPRRLAGESGRSGTRSAAEGADPVT